MSLINLSKYFDENHQSKYESYFLIKNYNAGVDLVNQYKVKNCLIIDKDCSLEEEITSINTLIRKEEMNLLFFEITERKLSDYVGLDSTIRKICVNFDGHILNDLDLVIDWDVDAHNFFDINKYPNTKFLLGPEFVILPKEFYSDRVKNRKMSLSNKKILIAMGGADEFDFTGKIVDVIIKSKLSIELTIIVGSGYEFKHALEERLSNSKLIYQIKQNITNMLDEYLNCDIGIGAGGLTSSELVASKTQAIIIATYQHQVARCQYFYKKGWVNYLGYRKFSPIELVRAIQHPVKAADDFVFSTHKIFNSINDGLNE